jgi:hypothetical protein
MLDGRLLHMRYAAHIINLIMKDGMAVMDKGLERVVIVLSFRVQHQKDMSALKGQQHK